MPQIIGAVVSGRLASKHELETVYGTEDLHDFLEILAIDGRNQREAQKKAEG